MMAGTYEALIAQAQRIWSEQPGAAQRLLVQALGEDGGRPEAYLLLAELMVDTGRVQRAEPYYQAAASVAPAARARLLGYYLDSGLPHAALALAEDLLDSDAVANLLAVYPKRTVTLAVTVLGRGASLKPTLDAVAEQSYPIDELLVVSDGLDEAALAEASASGARFIVLPGLTLGGARLAMLQVAAGEYLAYLDRSAIPSPHWLARLAVHLDQRHAYDGDPPWLCRDAGAATGHLVETHAHRPADAWRALHLIEHYMGGWGPAVHYLFVAGGLYRRELALALAGRAPLSDDQPDSDLARRLRDEGWRVAYEEFARCRRGTPTDVPGVLRAVRHHASPYYLSGALAHYQGGGLAGVAKVLPDRIKRGRVEAEVDRINKRFADFALISMLVGPTLVLDDLAAATRAAGPADRATVEQTHAAVYLALFALLGELNVDRDLLELIWLLTAEQRPRQPELAGLCEWAGVQATLDLAGGGAFNPFEFLPKRDQGLLNAFMHEYGAMLTEWSPADRQDVRRSALRLDDDGAEPKTRVGLMAEASDDTARLERALRDAGCATLLVEPYDEREQVARLDALLGFEPDWVVVCQPARGRWDLSAEELLADWCLELAEQLPSSPRVLALSPAAEAGALLAAAPNVAHVCREATEAVRLVSTLS